jgi:MFS family permease
VSQLGSQVSNLALPLVAVLVLHASAFRVALLGTVEMLPFLLFALPTGVWIDRMPRRPVLVVADLLRAAALASIPIAAAFGGLTIWQLYAVGFVVGTFTVFFDVAYQSYLPSLVGREHLVEGNAKLELSRSAAQIAGPGAGGVLIAAITAPYAIAVDAVSFLWSALLAARIRTREPVPERVENRSMLREIGEGLRYLLGDARWRALAAYVAAYNFGSTLLFSIYVVYAVRTLHLSPGELGLVFSLGNLGWLAGALVVRRVGGRFGAGPTMIVCALIGGAPNFLIPFAPRSLAIPFLVTAQIVVALGMVVFNVTGISLMQRLTPDHLLGRLNASRRWIVWGIQPLGALAGGVLATTAGLRPTLFIGAGITTLCFAFLFVKPIRTLRDLPGGEPVLSSEPLLRATVEVDA